MKSCYLKTLIVVFIIYTVYPVFSQESQPSVLDGLKFRSIGPATTSGRIADIAINPVNESIWYVAVGSGGVWKTENMGTTWDPVFEKQESYSIGCVTLDQANPNTVWVGTGENVGGRHVGFGDGVYVSHDAGKTWKNMGLRASEHISRIVVHPENPDIVWVAAQGPLWNKGGDRGLYKTTDGGLTWNKTLGDEAWTGVTDIELDPTNPDVIYAATWDRHRTVASYIGGGPGSGIYKSTDGGDSWTKLSEGIPSSNLGKIGLAVSPFDPATVYAAIELDRKKGGLFISTDAGASWTKQSDAVSGGTGPHYYQELYASPHQDGRLYLMSNTVLISDDHGSTFKEMNEENKHVDSHAMAFKPSDPDYVLFGTDGGLYESYDLTKTWRFFPNLPVTQYYKVAVDDAKPFYHIYGGTQDNGSHGGPSQTRSSGGILNSDWWKTIGADGHQSATEPGNPDITYAEYQQGVLWRIDQTTGETVFIQPQPGEGDPYERFNWDAPILVSPHKPSRIFFGSYRVWKSENRGDAWTPISGDLTRNEVRMSLPIMGRHPSWDNAWDVYAMSDYNTITSLAESPVQEGLIYAGTDDGILQVTEDGGASWRKIMLGDIKGVPQRAFVNDVRADLFDAGTVYLVLDNHKEGDFKPYLLKSADMGRTWNFINGDLPGRLLTWRVVQDHKDRNLLFAATEFGVYMTQNGGGKWTQLKGGLPTISFRDITIQRDQDDLVAASFGRGFYILDDISVLRNLKVQEPPAEAKLFPVRTADLFVQRAAMDSQGDTEFKGENPPYGAVFTYYLPDEIKSLHTIRVENEKPLRQNNTNIPFPGWEALAEETNQEEPLILFTITDGAGVVVNTIKGVNKKGVNRIAWGFNYAEREGVPQEEPQGEEDEWDKRTYLATPGTYQATLYQWVDGNLTMLDGPEAFEVRKLDEGALPGQPAEQINDFRERFQNFQQDLNQVKVELEEGTNIVNAMQRALQQAKKPSANLYAEIYSAREAFLDLNALMNGNSAKNQIGEDNPPSPGNAVTVGGRALGNTYGPTSNHIKALDRAEKQLAGVKDRLETLMQTTLPTLRSALKEAGAPRIAGQQ